MKKLLFLFACTITVSSLFAQKTAKDVFTSDEIVWYGIDFSKAKFVGQFSQAGEAGEISGSSIKSKYVGSWNGVIINEPEKYDLKKTFRKTSVYKDMAPVEKNNDKIDPDKLMTFNDYKFENADETVASVVKGFGKGEKESGIGVVFIVESFSKADKQGTMYVTFFDIASKKVLFKEKMVGKAGGIGLRNYWAATFREVLKEIDAKKFKEWKSTYGA